MEIRLTSSVHPLVRPTKSGLLNMLQGVLEISMSLRQPVYFSKFTSGLKNIQQYNVFSKVEFGENSQPDTYVHFQLHRCLIFIFILTTHIHSNSCCLLQSISTHCTLPCITQSCNKRFISSPTDSSPFLKYFFLFFKEFLVGGCVFCVFPSIKENYHLWC